MCTMCSVNYLCIVFFIISHKLKLKQDKIQSPNIQTSTGVCVGGGGGGEGSKII